jgi:hypothetical protein
MSLELGPCECLWGTAGAEVSLGKTEGGVVVTFATDRCNFCNRRC